MLKPFISGLHIARQLVFQQARRNIAVTAAVAQKADLDPIQQLFVQKIRDYAQKSKSAGGKLVDANPAVEDHLQGLLNKVDRMYGVKEGQDMTAFPTFNFSDKSLDPVGLGEVKELVEPKKAPSEVEEVLDEDPANIPYYEI